MLSKQLRRWSHGYLQNIRLHWKKMKKIPVLREQVIAALCDAFLGSIVLIVVLPLNSILFHDHLTILYALLADVSFISIPPIVKGYKMKMVQKVLSSLQLLNMYFFYNAFISVAGTPMSGIGGLFYVTLLGLAIITSQIK